MVALGAFYGLRGDFGDALEDECALGRPELPRRDREVENLLVPGKLYGLQHAQLDITISDRQLVAGELDGDVAADHGITTRSSRRR